MRRTLCSKLIWFSQFLYNFYLSRSLFDFNELSFLDLIMLKTKLQVMNSYLDLVPNIDVGDTRRQPRFENHFLSSL